MRKTNSFLIICLLFLASSVTIAQDTLTIGIGTSSSSTRGPLQRSDTASSTVFSRWVQTYTAAELATAGIISGNSITELQWELASSNTIIGTGNANAKIYIKNSSATAAVSDTWTNLITGSTLSYNTDYNTTNNFPGANGWMPFVLSTPFVYTGGALEIAVDWDCSTVTTHAFSGDGSIKWRWSSTGTDTLVAKRTGSSSAPTTISDLRDERANIQIIHTTPAPPPAVTACLTAPFTENFDTGVQPACVLTSFTTGSGWDFTPTFWNTNFCPSPGNNTTGVTPGNTGFVGMDQSGTDAGTILEFDTIDVSATPNPYLSFYYTMCDQGFTPPNELFVETWDGASWVILDSIKQGFGQWTEYNYILTANTFGTNLVKVRFRAESGGSGSDFNGDQGIDDVSIIEAPTCIKPSGLASLASATGVDLSWTDNNTPAATSWNIEYGAPGFAIGSGTQVTTSTNPHTLTALTVGNAYDWYVRAACSPTDTSLWVKGTSFNFAGAPIAGAYTIDSLLPTAGTNFQSFSDLAFTLNNAGISGAVTVTVMPNTYFDQFSLTDIVGASATNTIMINGGSSTTTTLSHDRSIRNSTVSLEGTSYITIKNLTIATTGGSNSWGVHMWDSAHHVLIDSNVITMPAVTSFNIAGILVSSSETSYFGQGANIADVIISNNTITGGERGIHLYGSFTATARNKNVTITNNDIQNCDDNGMNISGFDTLVVTNNYIVNATANTFNDGIYMTDIENFNISGNYAKGADLGFDADDLNFDNTVTTRSIISNNMFIGGDDAMWLDDAQEIDIFHNSTYAEDLGFYVNDDFNLDIRNNIFVSNSDFAFSCQDLSTTMVLDYNVYFTGGTSLANYNAAYVDLAAFIVGQPTLNARSLETDPLYTNPTTDLHASSPLINEAGDNTVGVIVDFDGDVRPSVGATFVDIGADEFTPPSCVLPGNLGTDSLTTTSTFAFWTESGTATQWEIQWDTAGFPLGTGNILVVNTDTFTTFSGLTFETNYDWYVRAICSRGDTSPYAGANTFFTGYCTPAPTSILGQGITGVAYGGVSNTTGAEAGNYFNYSAISGTLPQGLTANVDITLSSGFTTDVIIWVDWNNDLDFDDVGEEVYVGVAPNVNPTTLAASFLVPATTPLGSYRMRIGTVAFGTPTPCYALGFGSFEDYTINVTPIPSCFPALVNSATSITGSTALASWIETATATQWEVEYGTAGFTLGSGTSIIVNVDTFTTITALSADTDYEYRVRAICGPADSSTWTSLTSFKTPCADPSIATILPFLEGFETTPADTLEGANGSVVCDPSYSWGFETSGTTGRIRVGTASVFPSTGAGAATLDVNVNGAVVANSLILTLDIASYSAATNLELYFDYADHGDEDSPGDSVWVRGSSLSPWVGIYDLNPNTIANGVYTTVGPLDIDAALLAAGQAPSATFQVRFGQEDNFAATSATATDGITFDNISVNESPTCIAVVPGGSITPLATTANLNWSDVNSSPIFRVEYDTVGYVPGTARNVITVNLDTFVNLTGLAPETTYDWSVRAICAPTDSSASAGGSFTTNCLPSVAPYLENFDGLAVVNPFTALPNCWTDQTGPDFWDVTNGGTNSAQYLIQPTDHTTGTGNYMWIDASGDITANEMLTPIIDMSGLTVPLVGFWFASNNTNNTINHTISLDVFDGATWVNVTTESGNFAGWTEVSGIVPPGIPTTTQFRIQAIADPTGAAATYFFNDLGVDDFFVIEGPTCPKPIVNSGTVVTATTADISWINLSTATSFEVEWDTIGATTFRFSTVVAIDTFTTLTGLLPTTDYTWRVNAICSPTDSSLKSPGTFSTPATCPAPVANTGSIVTATTADVNWINNSAATSFQVEWDTVGATTFRFSTVVAVDTFTSLTGLLSSTDYNWRVTAICSPTDSSLKSAGTFSTPCLPSAAPYLENFDGLAVVNPFTALPTCWEPQVGPDFWDVTDGATNSGFYIQQPADHTTGTGNYMWVDASADITVNAMETPLIDMSALTVPYAGFWFASDNTFNSINHTISLDAWDGAAWVNVTTAIGNFTGWVEVADTLPAGIPTITKFRIQALANPNGVAADYFRNDLGVDDFFVVEAPTCLSPTANANVAANATTANLTWSGSLTTSYQIQYDTSGSTGLNNTFVVTGKIDSTITGLFTGRTYNWRVRSICSATDTSAWSFTQSFTTSACSDPTLLATAAIRDTSASFTWNDANSIMAPQYQISYDTTGYTLGTGTQMMTTSDSVNVTGLDTTTTYQWYVRAICAAGDSSAWVGPMSFTTLAPVPCSDPINLANSVITSSSASFTWMDANALAASGYQISYGSLGFTAGTGTQVMSATDSININGLSDTTSFDWYVRSVCAIGDTSGWAGPINFITLTAPVVVLPYYPIGTINTEDATTGVADSLNVSCWTSGTVVGIDLDGNAGLSFYISDMSSGSQEGINVFNFADVSGYVVTEGDSITIRGQVDQFNGLTELVVDSIEIISAGNAIPTATVVTALNESTEAQYISIPTRGVVLDTYTSGSGNVRMVNGTDTITMRIDSDTDIDDTLAALAISIIPGDTICGIVGVGGQFDNSAPFTGGHQIFPMRWSDLTICRDILTGINDEDVTSTEFKLVPNPTNGTFEIRSNGFNNSTINISIRDISGRVISSELVNNASSNFNKSFDLNNEASGVYFITILDGENVINKKLIVQ